ncbi:MAG: hypothetical protein MHM6MM_003065 [Cercozoa sp. M6MM]
MQRAARRGIRALMGQPSRAEVEGRHRMMQEVQRDMGRASTDSVAQVTAQKTAQEASSQAPRWYRDIGTVLGMAALAGTVFWLREDITAFDVIKESKRRTRYEEALQAGGGTKSAEQSPSHGMSAIEQEAWMHWTSLKGKNDAKQAARLARATVMLSDIVSQQRRFSEAERVLRDYIDFAHVVIADAGSDDAAAVRSKVLPPAVPVMLRLAQLFMHVHEALAQRSPHTDGVGASGATSDTQRSASSSSRRHSDLGQYAEQPLLQDAEELICEAIVVAESIPEDGLDDAGRNELLAAAHAQLVSLFAYQQRWNAVIAAGEEAKRLTALTEHETKSLLGKATVSAEALLRRAFLLNDIAVAESFQATVDVESSKSLQKKALRDARLAETLVVRFFAKNGVTLVDDSLDRKSPTAVLNETALARVASVFVNTAVTSMNENKLHAAQNSVTLARTLLPFLVSDSKSLVSQQLLMLEVNLNKLLAREKAAAQLNDGKARPTTHGNVDDLLEY